MPARPSFLYYLAASIALIWYLRSRRGVLYLPFSPAGLNLRSFGDILRVGGLSAIGTIQTNLTVILVTGAVGLFGGNAIAGYPHRVAARLSADSASLWSRNGRRDDDRNQHRREAIFPCASHCVRQWTPGIRIFGNTWVNDGTVSTRVARSLHARPRRACDGKHVLAHRGADVRPLRLGLVLYFASQGAGRVGWPVFAGTLRLAIAAGLGWSIVARLGGNLNALFLVVAASSVAFGTITAIAVWRLRWGSIS